MIQTCRTLPHRATPVSLLAMLVLTALAALLLTGCAAKKLPPPAGAMECWQRFAPYRQPVDAPGLLTNASLSWRHGRKSARVILDLWGDFAPVNLRMDAWSNLGGNLVYLIEDEQGLAAYYPDPQTVYTHSDPVRGALLLGLPFPFSLSDLAALMVGDYSTLVPQRFDEVAPGPADTWIFTFGYGPVETLTLDAAGMPVEMTGITTPPPSAPRLGGPWRIVLSRPATPLPGRPQLAGRMDLFLPDEAMGILRIKTRELTVGPWPEQAMELTIPEGVARRTLDGARRDWTTGKSDTESAHDASPQQEKP